MAKEKRDSRCDCPSEAAQALGVSHYCPIHGRCPERPQVPRPPVGTIVNIGGRYYLRMPDAVESLFKMRSGDEYIFERVYANERSFVASRKK